MHRYFNSFIDILDKIDFDTIENSPHSIYAISNKFELIYLNPGWFNFAKENNGEPEISEKFKIGTSIFKGIKGILSEYYYDKYSTVLNTLKPWSHEYQCSSNELYREFLQNVYPLKKGEGLLIVNSLKVEEPNDSVIHFEDSYQQKDGFIVQCSCCRKTQRENNHEIWDWVPRFVKKMPPNVSHSICPVCFDYYYKNHGK